MSDYIRSSLIDSESDGPHSPAPSSTFGSMNTNDSSLPTEKMEQLIRKLRSENKSLQLRVLGVNELARLLQDRNEVVKVFQDKNKRLEVAVVRLENRCANLEQKLRADGGGTTGPRSMQAPSIPGPSRQILEALMKENSELKKALNNMQKKGSSGYLEAVKTTQLEEVIDQQKQELDFLRGQINTLTTTPLPPPPTALAEEDKSQSGDSALGSINPGMVAGATGGAGSPGTLRRQLIKMQHALKVKDRFCSLLSDQVASLQEQLKHTTIDDTPEPEEEPSSKSTPGIQATDAADPSDAPYTPEGRSIEDHPHIKELKDQLKKQKEELEGRYEHLLEEKKDTLQKERQEHMSSVEKLQKSEQDVKRLSREMDALDKRCEDLQFLNHTLLDDKKQLQETIDQMKAAGGDGGGGGLERELRELQDTLQQKVIDHSEEIRNKEKELQQLQMLLEDTEYKYVIAHSKLSEIEKEHMQRLTDLKDKMDEKDMDASAKQNEIEDLRQTNLQLQMDMSSLRSKPSQPFPHEMISRSIAPIPPLMVAQHSMQFMEGVVKDGGHGEPVQPAHTDPTVSRPTHIQRCETNKLETVPRMELIARDPVEEPSSSQPQHPSSLPFHSQPNQSVPPHHPSPSPAATPHQMPPHAAPGRRSPITPVYQQSQARSTHQYPGHSQHLSTPVGSYPPTPRQVPQHYDPLNQHGQYYGPGQGARGPAPQPGSTQGRGGRPNESDHGMPPHGYHGGDPNHHHPHHPQRRN